MIDMRSLSAIFFVFYRFVYIVRCLRCK